MKPWTVFVCFVFASLVATPSFAQVNKNFRFDVTSVGYDAKHHTLVYAVGLKGTSTRHDSRAMHMERIDFNLPKVIDPSKPQRLALSSKTDQNKSAPLIKI